MKENLTFDFLKIHITSSIDSADSLLIGGFAGSVMELLGRILSFPNERANSTDRIYCFIKEYLSKQNKDYENFKEVFAFPFRNGGAHCVMPKAGVNLTSDVRSKELHLTLKKDYNFRPLDYYWFTILLPQFKIDLKNSILDFVSKAEKDQVIQDNYLAVFKVIAEEGNNFFRVKVSGGQYKVKPDQYISLQGDIKL